MSISLYYHPYSRAAGTLWALEEAGVDYDLKVIDIMKGEQKGPDLVSKNPMGKLPTLVDGDVVVTEAAAIALYLADRYQPGKLAPAPDDPLRATYLRWAFFAPSVIEGSLGRVRPAAGDAEDSTRPVAVPMMGRIAAGTPISAIQSRSHTIAVSPEFLTQGEHFALEVRGDSMIEAGILDGDTILVRKQDTADTGDIIVALIDDEEATLKRLRRRGASIALEAANPAYETRIFGPDRVRIQGKLVSLIRRY